MYRVNCHHCGTFKASSHQAYNLNRKRRARLLQRSLGGHCSVVASASRGMQVCQMHDMAYDEERDCIHCAGTVDAREPERFIDSVGECHGRMVIPTARSNVARQVQLQDPGPGPRRRSRSAARLCTSAWPPSTQLKTLTSTLCSPIAVCRIQPCALKHFGCKLQIGMSRL